MIQIKKKTGLGHGTESCMKSQPTKSCKILISLELLLVYDVFHQAMILEQFYAVAKSNNYIVPDKPAFNSMLIEV